VKSGDFEQDGASGGVVGVNLCVHRGHVVSGYAGTLGLFVALRVQVGTCAAQAYLGRGRDIEKVGLPDGKGHHVRDALLKEALGGEAMDKSNEALLGRLLLLVLGAGDLVDGCGACCSEKFGGHDVLS